MQPCPICRSSDGWRIAHTDDPDIAAWRRESGDDAAYFWTLCAGCGNAYPSQSPRPDILARYWRANRNVDTVAASPEAIWQQRIAMAKVGAERSRRVFTPLLKQPPARMLDIACGLGETVAAFARAGWQAEGLDVDAATKPFHEGLGITTRIGRIEDATELASYDFVHIAHAIYFITEPLQFLQRARALLAPGGIFGVVISDLLASTDNTLPAYPHTFYPCAVSMRAALSRAGLEPLLTERIGGSIFIAARSAEPAAPRVDARRIHAMYATKPLRHALVGRPNLALRRLVKSALKRGPQ